VNENKNKKYNWLKQIPSSLLKWDEIPLLGSSPDFPWDEFSASISKTLNLSDFKIEGSDIQWREKKNFFQGIANPVIHHASVNGIEGVVHWAMPKDEVTSLLTKLITDTDNINFAKDDELFASFHQFIAIEAIHSISQVNFDQNLAIHLADETDLPDEAALCVDVLITVFNKTITGRLLIPSEFQQSWKKHYAPKSPHAYLQSPLSEKLDLTVHLEAGQTYLSKTEWSNANSGDFLLLDNCWIDPKNQNGSVRLVINETPIFGGKVDGGQITIIETPPFQQVERHKEVQEIMVDNPNNDTEDEDFDFGDEDFDDSAFDDDFDDSAFDEDLSLEEKTELPEEESQNGTIAEGEQREENLESTTTEEKPSAHAEQASTVFKPEELPLSISIEVGRFQMSIKKLTELEPGNLLELGIRPENGVDLVINGKCIGRGELLRIGDTLGVRITEKS